MTPERERLMVQVARDARLRAHAPYSNFLVGATLMDEQGRVHAGANIEPLRQTMRVIDGVELVGFPEHMPPQFFGITDPEDVAWVSARLGPQPWACYTQPLVFGNEAAMRAIPESHIICTSTISWRDMDLLLERSQGRVWDIDTGHDLMMTEPDWTAARLKDVAASMD